MNAAAALNLERVMTRKTNESIFTCYFRYVALHFLSHQMLSEYQLKQVHKGTIPVLYSVEGRNKMMDILYYDNKHPDLFIFQVDVSFFL